MGLLIKNYETIALLEAHWLAAFERLLVGETLTFLSQAARAEGRALHGTKNGSLLLLL